MWKLFLSFVAFLANSISMFFGKKSFLRMISLRLSAKVNLPMVDFSIDLPVGDFPNLLMRDLLMTRDDNEAGHGQVSLSHTHPHRKNSYPSPYLNPTSIKILSHPHPHPVTGIFLYPYPYPFSYYSTKKTHISCQFCFDFFS